MVDHKLKTQKNEWKGTWMEEKRCSKKKDEQKKITYGKWDIIVVNSTT